MAGLFLDGMSTYATAQIADKYSAVDSSHCTFIQETAGRTNGCITRAATSNDSLAGYLSIAPLFTQAGVWTQQASGVWGAAIKPTLVSTFSGSPAIVTVQSLYGGLLTAMNGSVALFAVVPNSNGTFTVYRGGSVSQGAPFLLGTSLVGLIDGQWSYIEVRWVLSQGGNGTITIRANGTTIFSFTGRTCPNGSDSFPFPAPTALWNSLRVLGPISTVALNTVRMCDEYVVDLTGSVNNNFLGDGSVDYILPNAPGDATQWTPSAGANWDCVNEIPPNSDVDYVEGTSPGLLDQYNFQNVVGDPIMIQVCNYTRKTLATGASVAVSTRQGGVDYTGPTQGLGSVNYKYLLQPYDTNPATGVPYTEAEINAGQWGPLKVT